MNNDHRHRCGIVIVTLELRRVSLLPNGAMTGSVSCSSFTWTLSDVVVDAMRAAMEKADAFEDSCCFGGELGRLVTRTASMAAEDVVTNKRMVS